MFRKVRGVLVGMVLWSMSAVIAADSSLKQNLLTAADTKASGEYAFSQCRALTGLAFDANKQKKKALIVGDSYACDFLNSVQENGYLGDYQLALRFIPYDCQTVAGDDAPKHIAAKDRSFCATPERADSLERAKAQMQEADLVIFAFRWKPDIAAALPQTLRTLAFSPKQRVVVVGNKFFGKISVRQYLKMPANDLKALENEVDPEEAKTINAVLAKGLGKEVVFVDPHSLLCGDDTSCPLFTDDVNLISYDGRHLTKEGARYVGRVLFQRSALGKM